MCRLHDSFVRVLVVPGPIGVGNVPASVEICGGSDGSFFSKILPDVKIYPFRCPYIRKSEIRRVRLIDVVKPLKEVDEDKLKALWRKGKEVWAGFSSPTEWVEQLRES